MVAAMQQAGGAPGEDRGRDLDAVVVGLGETGLSCLRHLRGRGLRVAVTDSRAEPPGLERFRSAFPEVPAALGGFDRALLGRAPTVVLSPGVGRDDPRLAAALAGREVIGDIELFARAAHAPVVAITGSNGKSTVTSLLGDMCAAAALPAAVGGNLGTPALDLLAAGAVEAYVLELSSFQLETTASLDARAAAVLNVSADHLDRYRDLGAYAEAKARIYRGTGTMVLNLDDPVVRAMRRPGRETVTCSAAPGARADAGVRKHGGRAWIHWAGEPVAPLAGLGLRGGHNIANAVAATALAATLGLPLEAVAASLERFRGLPHRCQLVASRGGVDYIDDSKATNAGACCAALAGMDAYRAVVLVAGGRGKGGGYEPLAEAARGRLRAAVLIGEEAGRLEAALAGVAPVVRAGAMGEAVAAAAALAEPGDAVLLSPACASFDMYAGYAQRGRAFAAAVAELGR